MKRSARHPVLSALDQPLRLDVDRTRTLPLSQQHIRIAPVELFHYFRKLAPRQRSHSSHHRHDSWQHLADHASWHSPWERLRDDAASATRADAAESTAAAARIALKFRSACHQSRWLSLTQPHR